MTDAPDHRTDPAGWARALGVSRAAVDLHLSCDIVDLHVDTFIWTRVFGRDLRQRHGPGPFGARFFGHADLPRLREAGVTGAIWSITTNPLRGPRSRARVFERNLERLRGIFAAAPDQAVLVRDLPGYRAARATGQHAAFAGIQGGNALDRDADALKLLDGGEVVKVTLVHLSSSSLGETNAPGGNAEAGLTAAGKRYVEALDARRIFVDLAHIGRKAFFDAVDVHDRHKPLLVSHTGVSGVTPMWRNVDDEQLRAVAATGGVVGIIFHGGFLGARPWHGGSARAIVEHIAHACDVAGEDHVALGSDWDGAIVTPRDMPTCLELPRLVQCMLDRGFAEDRVRKVMGKNFLRALGDLRGT
jgi:membrane dipeptidase